MSGIRLSRRIAEETQLLAEEKWITEALNKIKKQRNCLQVRQNRKMLSDLYKFANKPCFYHIELWKL